MKGGNPQNEGTVHPYYFSKPYCAGVCVCVCVCCKRTILTIYITDRGGDLFEQVSRKKKRKLELSFFFSFFF